jgi:Flp pilus assembly protein TadD
VELSESKNWHCLAELARAYDKTGHPAQAIPLVRQALDLALQEHNDPLVKNLQELLDRYQRDTTQPQPQ